MAKKIPGCANPAAGTPDVTEQQDVTCTLPDGSVIEIGTFATAADERAWIQNGGTGSPPDPSFAGCCIQGSGWAATVGLNVQNVPMDQDFSRVVKAIGGRQVNG